MLYQSCWNNLVTGLIVPSSLLQFVNSLFQTCSNKFGTSSANTSCQQLVNRLVTTCLQVCSNLCVFTCVQSKQKYSTPKTRLIWSNKINRCEHTNFNSIIICNFKFLMIETPTHVKTHKLLQTCKQVVTSLFTSC